MVGAMSRLHPETISPTAHYTGYVWFAHGQSHEAFATRTGRLMYQALRYATITVALRAELGRLDDNLPAFYDEMRRLAGNPQARARLCERG